MMKSLLPAKHLTTQAKIPHQWEFRHDRWVAITGMPNINAALGCAQMEILKVCAQKRETASRYSDFFKKIEGFEFFSEPAGCRSNYWLNAVITKDRDTRDGFLQYTNNNEIMTRPIWELMNRLPMFRNCQTDGLKNTEWFAERVVNIPSSIRL